MPYPPVPRPLLSLSHARTSTTLLSRPALRRPTPARARRRRPALRRPAPPRRRPAPAVGGLAGELLLPLFFVFFSLFFLC